MNRDPQILDIVEKIQIGLKNKFNLELSTDVVLHLIDTQFSIIPEAMANKNVVKLNYMGKFGIKEGREEALQSYVDVHKDKSLLPSEKVEILKVRATSSRLERKEFKTKIIITR